MRLALAILLFALQLLTSSAVFAQDDGARAIQLLSEANTAYDAGDFKTALAKYREAYDITEDARVLYRIGITYENLANYQRAREHLELFLLADPNSKYAGRVSSKIENLRNLEQNLQSAVTIETTPPGANVWVDVDTGRPAGVTPVRIPVGPGSHEILLRKEGFEDVRDAVDVGTGETLKKTYDLGTGSGVVLDEAPPVEPPTEGNPSTVTTPPADPTVFAGEPRPVRFGPSTGVSVMSWIAIAVGWSLIVGSGAFTVQGGASDSLVGTGFFAGAGLVALGCYFLWFRDYTKDLPPAQARHFHGVPPQRAWGIGLRF